MKQVATLAVASALTLTLTLGFGGCTRGGKTAVSPRDGDIEETPAPEPEPEALPDTAYPSAELIKWTVRVLDTVTDGRIATYRDPYLSTPGTFAFRGNAYRDGRMGGRVEGRPTRITVDWKFKTESDERETGFGQAWGGGTGWTGQPLYVDWPDSMLRQFREAGTVSPGFSGKEVIVGSLSSRVYFIDFMTGEPSREPIDVGNPVKGTLMLDPEINGNLYLGHGVPNARPFGTVTVDLRRHAVAETLPEDPLAPRRWGAFDSSAVRAGQFVIQPGENGVIYKFLARPGGLNLHSAMSYRVHGAAPGMEASMSVYRNYGYIADNHGNVVCINLDTMRPVWAYSTGDDTDSTPAIAEEDGHPYLYVGSEIDRSTRGYAVYAKLDALDGTPVWERKIPGRRHDTDGKHFDGGFYSSPLLGSGNASHLLFINTVENLDRQNGKLLALDRQTGATAYEIPLKRYSWSSPVGFLNEEGRLYILTADGAGYLYLIDAAEGTVEATQLVGANFESSPVAAGNSAVIGSRGYYIYKVSLE